MTDLSTKLGRIYAIPAVTCAEAKTGNTHISVERIVADIDDIVNKFNIYMLIMALGAAIVSV